MPGSARPLLVVEQEIVFGDPLDPARRFGVHALRAVPFLKSFEHQRCHVRGYTTLWPDRCRRHYKKASWLKMLPVLLDLDEGVPS